MPLQSRSGVPEPPLVTSPSPSPSDQDAASARDYFAASTTQSDPRNRAPVPLTSRHDDSDDDLDGKPDQRPGSRRSRTRSRSPIDGQPLSSRMRALRSSQASKAQSSTQPGSNGRSISTNGHLAPPNVSPSSSSWVASWGHLSRSPSPLGLIPIHRHWRTFVHKYEVPRKALHVSIGFFVVWLYTTGTQTSSVPPYLMTALLPIASIDWLRHRYASINRLYVRLLGALMRESEYDGWNGVIFYLLGAWIVLYFFPKDVAVVSVLLLSWCDTAASTFGRLWGRYTPRIRRGKSLAGSLAAMLAGVATSVFFYAWLVPKYGPMPGDEGFMFKGVLSLPAALASKLGLSKASATIGGPLALGVVSLWSGLVASVSEAVDIFGWDDNLTIPVLSGSGIWAFLKIFT